MVGICPKCRFFGIDVATDDYSDLTPGDEFSMWCGKGKWQFDARGITEDEFAKIMGTAQICEDYRIRG